MKIALAVVALALLVLVGLPMIWTPAGSPAMPQSGLPWQISVLPDGGSEVFGLQPGVSTLAQARERFGAGPQLGLVAASGERGAIEAYYEQVSIGPLQGKLILRLAAEGAWVDEAKARSPKFEYMESSTRRYTLTDDDQTRAAALPIAALTFIPAAQLDAEIIEQRFGAPAEKVSLSEHVSQWLYPDQGVAITLDAKGREVIFYVAPRDFEERVLKPLRARPD